MRAFQAMCIRMHSHIARAVRRSEGAGEGEGKLGVVKAPINHPAKP